jgi:hypothetical protein
MKVKCPTCGAVGTDVEPVPKHLRGPSWKPLKGEDQYAFAVHGRHGGRAVRKCLNCGGGVYVKLLPPRYQAIPPDLWEQMQVYFEEQMAASEAHTRQVLDELAHEHEDDDRDETLATDPAFEVHIEKLVERVNELWPSEKNPLMRETRDAPPGDLERAIIKHVVRSTSPTYVIEAMERGAEPDRAQVDRETNVLMYLMAGGYLWRAAEREVASDDAPLEEAEFGAQWTKEHLSPEENERFEKLARAVFWTLESLSPLAMPSEGEDLNAEACLDAGFESIASFACQSAGLHPSQMILGEEEMREAFKAGVALREIEPYF